MRNYRFRLYPTDHQERKLIVSLETSRWVYNYFLNHPTMSLQDMQFALTELKEEEPWLQNFHSKMLQMVVHRIDGSRKALKVLQRNGHKTGKIAFAKSKDSNSFTYNQSGFKIVRHGNTDLLWLSKIGYIQLRLHRLVQHIKQITILRETNEWYAIICCEVSNRLFTFIDPRRSVGIDVGITKFSHDSDNHTISNPLYLTKTMKPLRRANRRLSRRREGSNNWNKAKTWLQILHQRIKRKRRDFAHKASHYYSQKYDIIFLERLHTLNMVKNSHLARHVLDSGWGTFKTLTEYKAKMTIDVNPKNTSVACSRCARNVPKSLAVRIHKCDGCGLVIDRDYNASLNIKRRGFCFLPQELREVTPVEILRESMKQEESTNMVESSQSLLSCQLQ
ncbi:MAG: RNA-guided endonuclease InsQ/TnpB family protein [Nitrososphaera sp.]|uniref:RNA-guided endonuclease InsQ/TnpB family protein n=1 Tax=Nitrososphaera sp. TaxID=1971748 RepID=UPI003D6FC04F